jgi:hypothetical protein
MPANAVQVADIIGVKPLVERLRAVSTGCNPSSTTSIEALRLHQQITEAVLTASLDVDGVLAEIDYERAEILEVQALLSGRRDRAVNLLSLANIVAGTGSAIVGTAMQFSDRTAIAGDAVGVAGGAAGVILSVLGLRQQGGKAYLGVAPNMLAPLFDRRPELRSRYPSDVLLYLETAPETDPRVHIPWRDELISEWVQTGRIGPPNAPASQTKIDLVTSRIGEHKRLSLSLLADRSSMLLDLRSRVALMTRDLRDLMKAVSTMP